MTLLSAERQYIVFFTLTNGLSVSFMWYRRKKSGEKRGERGISNSETGYNVRLPLSRADIRQVVLQLHHKKHTITTPAATGRALKQGVLQVFPMWNNTFQGF